jgi:murein DD-endopeptidase MepM/ murein hydrolase activator NlpD
MPASDFIAPGTRERWLRLLAIGLAAILLATLALLQAGPAEARDWTPRIKAARSAQIYWESAMRAADADVRAARAAKKQIKARIKRAKATHRVAVARRAKARRTLDDARAELRTSRAAARDATPAGAGSTPSPVPDPVAAKVALRIAGIDDGSVLPLSPVPLPAAGRPAPTAGHPGVTVSERELRLLEKRVKKQKRHFARTVRKAQRAARASRQARSELAALKSRERAAIARREYAERNLGSWILTMERYARGRATNMAKYRPGIDSPFAWPARGRISQYYSRSHDGLDIAGYKGSPIRAAAFGVVSYIGWNPWDKQGRAFMIVLAHAGGLETLYGHILPRRSVRIGQAVRQGEIIGYMGSTGNSTGPHLHFEVRRGRTTINPLGYL